MPASQAAYRGEKEGGMQWFRRGPEENPADFWKETARKRGGEIGFFTFATLLGRSADVVLNFPGLLYTVGDMVWFEDFERDNWLSRILGGKGKYQKTEISFPAAEIRSPALSRARTPRGASAAWPPRAPRGLFLRPQSSPRRLSSWGCVTDRRCFSKS